MTDETTQTTAAAVQNVLSAVDTQALLAETTEKGIQASQKTANLVRVMLEKQLSTANFNLVDDLNAKFGEFLRYGEMRERLNYLLEESTKSVSEKDVQSALDEAMEDIHEITAVLNPSATINGVSKFFGRIATAFRHGFKNQRQIFVYGLRDLKGKVMMVEQVLATEKQGIQNTVELVRTYLPAVTEDIVRLEYLARFLEQFIKSDTAKDLGDDAQTFLRDYLTALKTMKQVSSVSVLRVLMGLNRIVKAKFHLDKVQMKFTMNLGTLVFENLIANQVSTAYDIADSIEMGVAALEKKNEALDEKNRKREIEEKEKHLAVLKGLAGKLDKIQTDYDEYRAELKRLNQEVDDFLPEYNKTYEKLVDMRQNALNRDEATGEAMKELLGSAAWDEKNVVKEHEKLKQEREMMAAEMFPES